MISRTITVVWASLRILRVQSFPGYFDISNGKKETQICEILTKLIMLEDPH